MNWRPAEELSKVSVSAEKVALQPGETVQLQATVFFGEHSFTNRFVKFSSSDEAIVHVDPSTGEITAHDRGTATITAAAEDGSVAQCTVEVGELKAIFRLPEAVVCVEEEAFAGVNAEAFILPEGMTSIAARAFAECGSLRRITIPDGVSLIAEDAFSGSGNAVLFCASEESYAVEYAKVHGIAYVIE